ncbi:MAG: hypothetical protein ACYTG7_05310 [Planctomycetota bacterium]|jgi:hypothetical protein
MVRKACFPFLCCFILFLVAAAQTAYSDDPPLKAELSGGIITFDTATIENVGRVFAAFNSTDNEFRAVWNDSRISGQNDVYAQRVSADGVLQGTNVTIISGSESSSNSSIAHDPVNNQYLVTWKNQSGGPGSQGFNHAYGAIASATGGLITSVVDISNAGLEASVVFNSTDNQYVLTARNFAGGGAAGIYGRRVDASGALLGGNIIISTSGAPAPCGQVAYNPTANQVLSTFRNQTDETLEGRIINGDGTFATSVFVISSMFPESGMAAGAAFDPVNDRYLVVFSEFCNSGIYGQFVDSDGTLIGGTFTICASNNHRLQPLVAFDPIHGAYLAAWTDSDTGKLSVQLLYSDGTNAGDPVAVPNPASASGPPHVTANTLDGGFLVTWPDRDYGGGEYHAMGQLIDVVPSLLVADNHEISARFGGVVNFSLLAGDDNANRNYLLLGTASGTSPGTLLPGGLATMPLNWDALTDVVMLLLNTSLFSNFLGVLDGAGQAAAQIDAPPLPGVAVGAELDFAYALNNPFDFVSNPEHITIVP